MKHLSPLIIALSLTSLIGCSTPAPNKVVQINALQIPFILPGTHTLPASHTALLYKCNKQDIDSLTGALKKQYLQDVKTKDIFAQDSDIQPVYASLSKLEALGMINQQYLKEQNEVGLQQIHLVLNPIIRG